jgi:hypothetical protein
MNKVRIPRNERGDVLSLSLPRYDMKKCVLLGGALLSSLHTHTHRLIECITTIRPKAQKERRKNIMQLYC